LAEKEVVNQVFPQIFFFEAVCIPVGLGEEYPAEESEPSQFHLFV
jgi:hypothetical protein